MKLSQAIILVILITIATYFCYHMGKEDQIKDNIKHGVMHDNGEWKDGFKLAR